MNDRKSENREFEDIMEEEEDEEEKLVGKNTFKSKESIDTDKNSNDVIYKNNLKV